MEVAAHEALVRQAYKDSEGVLTWCVGMTNATGHRVERYIGKPQTLQHCMNIYAWALTNYAEQVREVFKDRPLTQAQFAAALSFHWNTGAIKRATWVKYWLRGDVERAREAFMNWVTPSSIAARRGKERDLFFDGRWSNNGTMTEFTRVTSQMTPDWSSGKRINVEDELRLAFASTPQVVVDQAPQPDAVPPAPTLTPATDDIVVTEPDHTPAPSPAPQEPTMPAPTPSPVEQVNKAVGAAKWVGVASAIWLVIVSADVLPDAFASAEFTTAVNGLIAAVAAAIGAYRAPRNAEPS
ncbi:glycoside hydrolase family protein [Georhizobium sp. MAB10]|uniref:glycoside hydrolase family protein n=1 Tax=Georhizobium sp. MAB10 TaxID=3028319 RepID=UPI0038557892